MIDILPKKGILNFNNKYGTALALRGIMNNLNVSNEIKTMASNLGVEVTAEEQNFFERYIAFVCDNKSTLAYFLYLARKYEEDITLLEKTFQGNPVFN